MTDEELLEQISRNRQKRLENAEKFIDTRMTNKEYEVYKTIKKLQKDGEEITVRLIACVLGKAPSTIHKHLKKLKNKGCIDFTNKKGSIRVIRRANDTYRNKWRYYLQSW